VSELGSGGPGSPRSGRQRPGRGRPGSRRPGPRWRAAAASRQRGQPVNRSSAHPPAQQTRTRGESRNAATNRAKPGRGSGAAGAGPGLDWPLLDRPGLVWDRALAGVDGSLQTRPGRELSGHRSPPCRWAASAGRLAAAWSAGSPARRCRWSPWPAARALGPQPGPAGVPRRRSDRGGAGSSPGPTAGRVRLGSSYPFGASVGPIGSGRIGGALLWCLAPGRLSAAGAPTC
jgi:hypothetical protein